MIETRNISKRYGEQLVVDDVSLQLPAQGIVSIIGPNGAGKSSLLSMVSRLARMSAGSAWVDGMDVTRTPGDVLARRLSILRQDNHIESRLSVWDLVAFGRYPHSKGRLSTIDKAKVQQAIEYLNLQPYANRYLDELSGGQRQRAFVAMVLCQDTDYVLLDEPLNSLDMPHAIAMMRQLRHAADTLGKTVVAVLHDINFASSYSDHIVAMRDGRVVAQGAPSSIIQPDVLKTIYGIDIAVHVIEGRPLAVCY
ncbi:ATP-binding cassette domain-containing protein [Pseudomonas sp. Je.1.5.c]|uniref:iron ABC transporter ATP-binding protein n=1 Tax=Pseudomonas sp. Je.1.5.c TaxID=3142839 RepID=UPI003DA9457A